MRIIKWSQRLGIEPLALTSIKNGAENGNWTHDPTLTMGVLYPWAISAYYPLGSKGPENVAYGKIFANKKYKENPRTKKNPPGKGGFFLKRN